MNSYDDLQRFKDKTRNNMLEFKEMSPQGTGQSTGGWAIINQLMPDDGQPPLFSGAARTSGNAHDTVSSDAFVVKENAVSGSIGHTDAAPSAVIKQDAPALLKDIAAMGNVGPSTPSASGSENTVTTDTRPSVQAPAMPSATGVNFSQLFAPTSPPVTSRSAVREMPLQLLLERIASCR